MTPDSERLRVKASYSSVTIPDAINGEVSTNRVERHPTSRGLLTLVGDMEDTANLNLIYIAVFCLGGLVFSVGPFVLVHLLAARKTRQTLQKTDQAIECGMDPIGDAWVRYSAVYYLYALIFIAFAVDVLFLIPVALVYNRVPQIGARDFVEMVIFVGILSLVIVYPWKKGLLEWKRKPNPPKTQ
jgi:NADH:ubiquinone oxidoreductase subunit 3 (subunit A)